MKKLFLATLMFGLSFISCPVFAADGDFTDKQKEQIEAVVKNLLTNKDPEIVLTAAREFQKKQDEENGKKAKEALGKNKDKLTGIATDPILGNPKGDVTIVEFTDYNCGYCKKANEPMLKLVAADKDVKFIIKDYPILAASSTTAAKAAIAANKQKKYAEMHNALMDHKGGLTDDGILEIAVKAGLDKEKLKKDMEAPDVLAAIEANKALGREIGANGTPTFIIGDKVVPGAMDFEEMKKLVDEARAAKK